MEIIDKKRTAELERLVAENEKRQAKEVQQAEVS